MSNAINFNDVIRQLEVDGLDVSDFRVGTTKPMRCRVDGERDRKGWYWIHEMPFDNGDVVLVGSYGIWHGQDNGARKLLLPEASLLSKEDQALVRRRIAENKRRMAGEIKQKQERAAKEAQNKWQALAKEGESGYLTRKQVRASGVRYTKDGAVAIPMRDGKGKLHGLQFILDKENPAHAEKVKQLGGDKRFWPTGMSMQGHYHTIGRVNTTGLNLITEGYATGDTLADASGLPCLVAFNANNVIPVLESVAKQYPKASFLIAADDDYICTCQHCKKPTLVASPNCAHCEKEHGKQNTGVTIAMKACVSVDAAQWFKPLFEDRQGKKYTDFNDLMMLEGLQVVASQVEEAVAAKFPSLGQATLQGQVVSVRADASGGAGEKVLASMISLEEAVERFWLVFDAKDMVYDRYLRKILPLKSMQNIIPDHAARDWKEDSQRQVVQIDDITFDATCKTKKRINMWEGFPTGESDAGSCQAILDVLSYICSQEKNAKEVLHQVLCFLAYPLQHHGAKLDMCLLFQGVQGTGKSLIFEDVMMEIYQQYSVIIGQTDIESQFNSWASKKLFVVADEVIAKKDLYQVPGKIKNLITGTHIPIRTLFTPTYQELNQINFVFLSNEVLPMVLDDKDRRFLVIKTPDVPLDKSYYDTVGKEIEEGGIEAFHHYLLHYDVGEFNQHTRPIMTNAKLDLITACKPATSRFYDLWLESRGVPFEEVKNSPLGLPYVMCSTDDLYKAFRRWCSHEGETYIPSRNAFVSQISFLPGLQRKQVRACADYRFINDGSGMVRVSGDKRFVRCIDPVDKQSQLDNNLGQLESCTVQILQFRRALDDQINDI